MIKYNHIINLTHSAQSINSLLVRLAITGWVLCINFMLIKCSTCKVLKDDKEFYKNAYRKNGFGSECKICSKIKAKLWYEKNKDLRKYENRERAGKWRKDRKYNLETFLRITYSYAKKRISLTGGRSFYIGMPICGREEFVNFGLKDKILNKLFIDWKKFNYKRKYTPSLDRIDNSKGYTLDNIQFLTVSDNSKKRWAEGLFLKHKTKIDSTYKIK